MDTVKRVSSGTTYLLRNGKNTVHMSPIELKECNYISYSIYIYVFQVFWLCICSTRTFFAFFKILKVAVMVQRSGEALSLLYP